MQGSGTRGPGLRNTLSLNTVQPPENIQKMEFQLWKKRKLRKWTYAKSIYIGFNIRPGWPEVKGAAPVWSSNSRWNKQNRNESNKTQSPLDTPSLCNTHHIHVRTHSQRKFEGRLSNINDLKFMKMSTPLNYCHSECNMAFCVTQTAEFVLSGHNCSK